MNLSLAYPEVILLLLTLGILAADLFLPRKKQGMTWLFALAATAICAGAVLYFCPWQSAVYAFGGMFVSDAVSLLLKLFSCLLFFITLLYARRYVDEHGMMGGVIGGEYYVLALFCLLGQLVVISGVHFLVLYLGIELVSLPLYALAAMRRNTERVPEAAVKFFVLGALGSGFLLYGISMLYGATGTLDLREMCQACASGQVNHTVLVFGVVFAVSGIGFKLGAAPFHMWIPDVYEGAPASVTLLIGGVPKLAAFALGFRILAEGLVPLADDWQQMLAVLALLSMTVGNLTALVQANIRRMLAYSTIGQMGFMLLGLLSGANGGAFSVFAADAYGSALFYTFIYVLAFVGAFGVLMVLSRTGYEAQMRDDFRGLGRTHPWLAFFMMVFMLSLAGIPPVAGFYAKLSVLEALVASGQVWLAIVAIVLSVIGAFYYLRIVKLMYFDAPAVEGKTAVSHFEIVVLACNAAAVVLPGLLPGWLIGLCHGSMAAVLPL
ncbi:MAG: NADH-quinone oxidoreductase subunit NuoN [Oxalobacter formigenes]|nr:NADH-quinone oxidoreductase subunit NuoN [Oxalobacter formigenes]